MTNEEIRRMMSLVDEKYIDELTGSYQQGSTVDFSEEESSDVIEEKRRFPWRSFAAVAAAFVLLIPGTLLLRSAMDARVLDPSGMQTGEVTQVTETPVQSRVPFAEELEGRELLFDLVQKDEPFYLRKLDSDAEGAFLAALETLSWEPLEIYTPDNENPIGISGTYFTMYADRESPDGFAVTFARDNGQILWGNSTEIRTYILTAEEFDMLKAIVHPDATAETEEEVLGISYETLDEANADDYPWKGRVLWPNCIGQFHLTSAASSPKNAGRAYDDLLLVYTNENDPEQCIQIRYTTQDIEEMLSSDTPPAIPAEILSTDLIGIGIEDPNKNDGHSLLHVECGDFRIRVMVSGCTRHELADTITAIEAGLHALDGTDLPKEPENGETLVDDVTYAQAKAVLNVALPDETMGWESAPESVMKLEGIQLHQVHSGIVNGSGQFVSRGVDKWLELHYKGEGGALRIIVSSPGILEKYSLITDVPELTDWSMKIVPHEPYAKLQEDGHYDFWFWSRFDFDEMAASENMDVSVIGTCASEAIDPFVNFYSNVKTFGEMPYRQLDLSAVNEQYALWKGDVITVETIGSYNFKLAYLTTWKETEGLLRMETLSYGDASEPQLTIGISYTTLSAANCYVETVTEEELDAKTILTEDRFRLPNPDDVPAERAFVIDRGTYRIRVRMTEGISQEDLEALLKLL